MDHAVSSGTAGNQAPAVAPSFDVSVRVCRARVGAAERGALERALATEELARRDRFRHTADADRFLVGRATLRSMLGRALGVAPQDVPIAVGPHGKLHVASGSLELSVAHSGDVVLVALSTGAAIGVDVERVTAAVLDEPLDAMLSARDAAAVAALPAELRVAAFFHAWTSREAIVKVTGLGFALPREAFDVAVDPRCAPALVAARAPELALPLTLVPLAVAPGHTAMLAVAASAGAFRIGLES